MASLKVCARSPCQRMRAYAWVLSAWPAFPIGSIDQAGRIPRPLPSCKTTLDAAACLDAKLGSVQLP
eukprot:278663-Chlamydomonas_euryale.AAC.1